MIEFWWILIVLKLFSLCYHLLIIIWTFFVSVFVLLLGFTDGFGSLSLCISVFKDCMYFTFDYYIHLIIADWFTTFFVSYLLFCCCFWILMHNISASTCINWESTRNQEYISRNIYHLTTKDWVQVNPIQQ